MKSAPPLEPKLDQQLPESKHTFSFSLRYRAEYCNLRVPAGWRRSKASTTRGHEGSRRNSREPAAARLGNRLQIAFFLAEPWCHARFSALADTAANGGLGMEAGRQSWVPSRIHIRALLSSIHSTFTLPKGR